MVPEKNPFGEDPKKLHVDDSQRLQKCRSALIDAAQKENAQGLLAKLNDNGPEAQLLVSAMALSDYLHSGIISYIASVEAALTIGVDAEVERLLTSASVQTDADENAMMAHLRKVKGAAHILIALGDLSGTFDLETTTGHLTRLSEVTLSVALDWLLLDLHAAGKIHLSDTENPSQGSGLIVLGMGKMGGQELNYSSDIDIVIYFETEPTHLRFGDGEDPTTLFGRMVRRLVRIMQDRTADGYVFRTDLRLRPDPGATPLAINCEAALNYYEARGQNWERAAFIKARPVAGDLIAGERFLAELKPFIWRKYLDYAAISDIQSIKRQIHAHKGHGTITIHGHNLKLGRGGIREIEFFVQTQQLIAGGRTVNLRGRSTIAMLKELAANRWINETVCADMISAYNFLRRAEHAVQMIADEQTHDLPKNDEELAIVSCLLGYRELASFKNDLADTFKTVERHFGDLFEQQGALSSTAGNLVFTGDEPDPDTLATLASMGFSRPRDMWAVIRTWHFGRYRALQSEKAREQLTAMMPSLLDSFAQTGAAEATLLRFDEFLSGLPAGMQLFSMLNSNRHLLTLLSTILSAAPRLAEIITKRPLIFDGMLDPAFFQTVPERSEIKKRLNEFLGDARLYEDYLDRLRIFAAEQRFLIGLRFLTGSIDAQTTGKALSGLADELLTQALNLASNEVRAKHGSIVGAEICLVAMGRLGSEELTAGSDVDLLLIYDGCGDDVVSDGAKPLPPSQYFARLTQRLIAALSAPTAEGVLYEVDFRLRPSGNKGPLATSLRAFEKYQKNDAWTWEHMALTRARIVSGGERLSEKFDQVRMDVICGNRDVEKTREAVSDMRHRLERDKPASSAWDLKVAPGGMVDIEFLAQYFMLAALPICNDELPNSNLNLRSAADILSASNEEVLPSEDKDKLLDALRFFTTIDHLVKLCSSSTFRPDDAPKGLLEQICSATNLPDIKHVENDLVAHQNAVRSIFSRVLNFKSG